MSATAECAPTGEVRLAVVVLNYRTPDLVEGALESLESELDPTQDVAIVVDNASGDGSADRIDEMLARRGWSWARLVRSERNGGFSAGNNVGCRAVSARFYLLMNSDAYVRPGAVATLLETAEAHPDAGLLSPRLEWPDGTPQISCFRFHSPASELINAAGTGPVTKLLGRFNVPIPVEDHPTRPDWTSFACVMIRRETFDAVGEMDEDYFMYYEDVDYCRRARDLGWSVLNWPQARVVHLRGGTSPVKSSMAVRDRPPSYYYASRSLYFRKAFGVLGPWLANAGWLAGRLVAGVRELVGHKQPHACERAWCDIWIGALDPKGAARPPGAPAVGQ